MAGVLLWLCWMIVEEYMLVCWTDECIWLKYIPCGAWWPLMMNQMVWKMDFDRLMGWEKLKFFFNGSWFPFACCSAKSLQLPWWYLIVDQLYLIFFRIPKVHFWHFYFLIKNFQLWLPILGGYLWDMVSTCDLPLGLSVSRAIRWGAAICKICSNHARSSNLYFYWNMAWQCPNKNTFDSKSGGGGKRNKNATHKKRVVHGNICGS